MSLGRTKLSCFLLALLLIVCCLGARAESVQVKVDGGSLHGALKGGVQNFRGVPYAAAPVGVLRWRAPQSVAAWAGVRDATNFGAACPQATAPDLIDGAAAQMSEDCLSLNIWAPAHTQRPAPVMVWVHGGGNASGAGSKRYYDGTAFARDGIVLVSINYRLGVLGFFAHPVLTAEAGRGEPLANFGLMDQVAALKWVRKNIGGFGGDAKNVTLFGESAGGEDILALMTAPSAQGLFEKAIVESGGGWAHLPTLAEAEVEGSKMAGALGLGGGVTAEKMRNVPAEAVVKLAPNGIGLVMDGRLLPSNPTRVFAQGRAAHVPLMIGSNDYEGSLMDAYDVKTSEVLGKFSGAELAQARAFYGSGMSDDALARALFRDLNFAGPARWVARQSSGSAPVFLYRFTYVRQRQMGRVAGASHGSEIPYVFDSWQQAPMQGTFLGPRDQAEVGVLHKAWVAFAVAGTPAYAGGPVWPAYRSASDELFEFGSEAAGVRGGEGGKLDFLQMHANGKNAGDFSAK